MRVVIRFNVFLLGGYYHWASVRERVGCEIGSPLIEIIRMDR